MNCPFVGLNITRTVRHKQDQRIHYFKLVLGLLYITLTNSRSFVTREKIISASTSTWNFVIYVLWKLCWITHFGNHSLVIWPEKFVKLTVSSRFLWTKWSLLPQSLWDNFIFTILLHICVDRWASNMPCLLIKRQAGKFNLQSSVVTKWLPFVLSGNKYGNVLA